MPPLTLPESIEISRSAMVALGAPGLFAVAFLEFFLLPVPPDLVLIPLAVARPEFALLYAGVATAGSVTAGLVGFAVGRAGGRAALESRSSGDRVDRMEGFVDRRGLETLAFGAFAPIPEGFELLSVCAGAFRMDVRTYLVASVAGRGGKYALEAALALALGEAARTLSEPELYGALAVAALLALAAYVFRRRWLPQRWLAIAD